MVLIQIQIQWPYSKWCHKLHLYLFHLHSSGTICGAIPSSEVRGFNFLMVFVPEDYSEIRYVTVLPDSVTVSRWLKHRIFNLLMFFVPEDYSEFRAMMMCAYVYILCGSHIPTMVFWRGNMIRGTVAANSSGMLAR